MPTNYQPWKEFPDQKIKLVSIYDTVVLGSGNSRSGVTSSSGLVLPLDNETKMAYSFVSKFLTKRWFCDGDTNQTQ